MDIQDNLSVIFRLSNSVKKINDLEFLMRKKEIPAKILLTMVPKVRGL